MLSKRYRAEERTAAIANLGRLGDNAEKAVPVLLEILKLSASDIEAFHEPFRNSADSLAKIGVSGRGVTATLKQFRDGKGIRPAKSHWIAEAKVVADTALRSLHSSDGMHQD
ncbi:MAG: hypothetical protein ACREHD_31010 [Pirellulales bacterium]